MSDDSDAVLLLAAQRTIAAQAAEIKCLREALIYINGMVDAATQAPLTADRWLDRIEECARESLRKTGGLE